MDDCHESPGARSCTEPRRRLAWAGRRGRLATAQAAQAPRVLRIRIEKDISALDPAHAGTRSEHAVVWALSNRLTMFKPTGDKLGLAARPRPRAQAGERHPRALHAPAGRPVDERVRRGDRRGREVLVRAVPRPEPEVRERGRLEAAGACRGGGQVHRGDRAQGAVPGPLDLVAAPHLRRHRVQEGGRGRRRQLQEQPAGHVRGRTS